MIREVTIDLPHLLVESLGVGAEVLANYLTELAEAAGMTMLIEVFLGHLNIHLGPMLLQTQI
jgi:hypothetical protein